MRLRLSLSAALWLLLAPALLLGASARAQPSEEAVKAAFLPKFARYVEWPSGARPGPGQPFSFCLIGADPFGRLIDRAAANELIEGRQVAVRRMRTTEGAAGCHFAYVWGATQEETSRFLAALSGQAVLTITDARAGPERGMVHFTVVGGRVRFFIDEATAAQRGLTISSRLLALALGVRQRRW